MTDDPFDRAVSRTRSRRRRRRAAAARMSLRIHTAVYLAVNAMLALIWWTSPSSGSAIPWVLYPAVFWGVGLAAHWWAVRGAWHRPASDVRNGGSEPG